MISGNLDKTQRSAGYGKVGARVILQAVARGPAYVACPNCAMQLLHGRRCFLAPYLEEVDKAKTEKLETFIYENPSYRAVVKYCPEVKKEFDPSTPDDKMSELLAKHKGIADYKLKLASSKLLKSQAESVDEIKAEYEAISEKIGDFSRDNRASHMVFRKMIIDLLARKLESNSDGKYPDEAVIHDIIFPRKAKVSKTSSSSRWHNGLACTAHDLRGILMRYNVAVLGASTNPERYSYKAVKMLSESDYGVFPVHPSERAG